MTLIQAGTLLVLALTVTTLAGGLYRLKRSGSKKTKDTNS